MVYTTAQLLGALLTVDGRAVEGGAVELPPNARLLLDVLVEGSAPGALLDDLVTTVAQTQAARDEAVAAAEAAAGGGGGTGTGVNPDDVGYDVILAAGQSNMWGQYGPVDATYLDAPDDRVFVWPGSGTYAEQRIIKATEPLPHPETSGYGAPSGMGPALVFSRWLALGIPSNRRVLIVARAVGGTKLTAAAEWDPAGTGNLYTAAIAQTNAAIAAAGPNARFAGVLWLQGESDALAGVTGAAYQAKLDALISGWRGAITGAADAPFVVLGMVPEFASGTAAAIRAVHADTPNRVTSSAYVAGPTGMNAGDNLHYSGDGQRVLGKAAYYQGWRNLSAPAVPTTPTAPNAPTGLTATPSGSDITLAWTAPANNGGSAITGYKVEQQYNGGAWSIVATPTGTTTTRTGLAGGSYSWRVSAVNAIGTGSPSATASASISTPTTLPINDTMTGTNGTLVTAHIPDSGGSPWTKPTGTATLTLNGSGKAVVGGATGTATKFHQNVSVANASASLELTLFADGDVEVGPMVRAGSDGVSGLWFCRINSTQFAVIQNNAGSVSLVTASVGAGLSAGASIRMTLGVTGTAITASIQRLSDNQYLTSAGTWQSAATDCCTGTAGLTAAGGVGIFVAGTSSDTNGSTVDNFTASAL